MVFSSSSHLPTKYMMSLFLIPELDVYRIKFICTVIDSDVILAVVLVVIQIILGVIVLVKLIKGVVIGGIIVIPGLKVCAIGVFVIGSISNIIGGVVVQEIREANIGLVVIRVIGRVMDGIESPVVAVTDL